MKQRCKARICVEKMKKSRKGGGEGLGAAPGPALPKCPVARSPTAGSTGPSGGRKSNRYPSLGDIVKVDYEDDGGWMFGKVESIDVARNAVEVDFEDGEMVWVEVSEVLGRKIGLESD